MGSKFLEIKRMKLQKNKTLSIVTLVLLLTLTIFVTNIGSIEAATFQPSAYLSVSPNPVGVNQLVVVTFWTSPINPVVDEEMNEFTVIITKPDGTTETRVYQPFPHGSFYFEYTPAVVGEYDFKFTYPGETFSNGDVFLPAESPITTLVVQEEPVPTIPHLPIPTDYWERPISTENPNWASISGSWLQWSYDSTRGMGYGASMGGFSPYSQAPRSAHIMWTKENEIGGLVGGHSGTIGYYSGGTYDPHVDPPIIIGGKLFYNTHKSNANMGVEITYEGFACVDLRTGEELWRNDQGSIDAGQLFKTNTVNGDGVVPLLWDMRGNTWDVYDPFTGEWIFAFENTTERKVQQYGGQCGLVRELDGSMSYYILDGANNWLARWNSTRAFEGRYDPWTGEFEGAGIYGVYDQGLTYYAPYPGTFDWNDGLEWNVTIPERRGIGGNYDPNEILSPYLMAISGDIILGVVDDYADSVFWVIAYDRNTGQELWASQDQTQGFMRVIDEDIYATFSLRTSTWTGYDIKTGNKIWESEPNNYPWGSYISYAGDNAYGKLYSGSWDGYMRARDVETGSTVWEFSSGTTTETVQNTWPMWFGPIIADGVVFCGTGEETPTQPLTRGNRVFALDAETGEEIWSIAGMMTLRAIADGYLVAANDYDNRLYVFGKGPSATTVDAPKIAVEVGQSFTITGTVTDQSASAMGTPAISDEDMSAWMEYLYMQKPFPSDAKGVTVTLSTLDPNGNNVHIGEATSDTDGNFGFTWAPQVPGTHQIIATFAGSESYGSSYATCYLSVVGVLMIRRPPRSTPAPMTDTYIAGSAVAIIAAIAIGVALILWKK
jgi:hypothetical protein